MTEEDISIQIIERLGLTKRYRLGGASNMCSCPFHKDKHPSMSFKILSDGGGIYHCFSCGAGGTLRQLFRDIKGASINKELNIPWEKQDDAEADKFTSLFRKEEDDEEEEDFEATPDVHIGLSGTFIQPEVSKEAQLYLAKRCIPLQVAKKMKMKYAALGKSYDILDPENKEMQVNFTDRLIIPIYENGKLLSCEGREIHGKDAFEKKMKSLGKEDAIYKKCIYPKGASTSTLYQLDKLDKSKTLYFCEGLMDLAVLRSDPFFDETNSTAIFGATISKRQLKLLQEFDSFCYIIDNDLAGFLSLRKLFDGLAKNQFFYQKDWKFVIPPFHDLGVKDVGDIPVKTHKTVEMCRNMKWLNTSKAIVNSKMFIDNKILELQEEKRKCESV